MNRRFSLHVAAELENLAVVRRFVQEAAEVLSVEPSAIDDVVLAVDEAVTNIVTHGYRGRQGGVDIDVTQDGDSLVVRLQDNAPAFDLAAVPLPDIALPLEQRPLGGMGVYLMRQAVDEVIYRALPRGNELTLIKRNVVYSQ